MTVSERSVAIQTFDQCSNYRPRLNKNLFGVSWGIGEARNSRARSRRGDGEA